MIEDLLSDHLDSVEQDEGAAWDLCRAVRLAGTMYMCRMIDRATMDQLYLRLAKELRRHFSSWEEMERDYLLGYSERQLNSREEAEARGNIDTYVGILNCQRQMAHGPYSIPWDAPLTIDGKSTLLKTVFRRYRVAPMPRRSLLSSN